MARVPLLFFFLVVSDDSTVLFLQALQFVLVFGQIGKQFIYIDLHSEFSLVHQSDADVVVFSRGVHHFDAVTMICAAA